MLPVAPGSRVEVTRTPHAGGAAGAGELDTGGRTRS